MQWLFVALGGAFGAMARFGVSIWVYPLMGNRFPLGTVVVNIAGSLLMGVCYVLIMEKASLSPEWRSLLMIGFLGAFTTFSTFSLDALALWQNGHLSLALLYVVGSVLLCLAATSGAISLTRWLA